MTKKKNIDIELTKIIIDGLVKLFHAIKCKMLCCKSSCNTNDDLEI